MNKYFFSLLVTLFASAGFAQINSVERGKTPSPRISKKKPGITPSSAQSKAVIWSSDFSNSQDWIVGNSAGNNADWEISDAPSFWWSANASLASSSGGYAASFNSDSYAMAANQIENNAWIQSEPFNCSNFSTVSVNFQQYFNKWTGRTLIQVSNDDGQTWVDYEVNENLENNDETNNPEITMVDITATAANQQEVSIRFLYLSNAISDGGTDNTEGHAWDYGWIVDDVEVAELPDNDIALLSAWHANIISGYEYSQVPLSQTREMIPCVVVVNEGALEQTFEVQATITDATGIVNTSTEAFSLPYGVRDTVWLPTGFIPSANGEYNVSFSLPPDEDVSDNQISAAPLFVDDNIMAHDYGNASVFGWDPNALNPTTVTFANAPHAWGNIYVAENDQEIFGIDVNFANGTTAGLSVNVRVQRFDAIGGIQGNLQLVTEQVYEVEASDVGNGITTIPFDQPSMLIAGSGYIIDVYKVDQTSEEGFFLGGSESASEDDDLSTVAYGPYGASGEVNYYVNWGFAPYIRANFNSILNTEELTANAFSMYPNPTNGIVELYNATGEESHIEIVNVDGKIMQSFNVSGSTNINLSDYSAGVYLIKISNASGTHLERIILK